ncbi:SCO family protein [Kaarinaea lacus]
MENIAENKVRDNFAFRKIHWVAGIVFLVLAVAIIYGNIFTGKKQYPESVREVVYPEFRSLQPFNLVDHENHEFGLQQLEGSWTFLVFGYTHCPDICPATLSQLTFLSQSIDKKIARGLLPKFLFVSVDPARDKAEVLHDYIKYFDDGFIAATGSIKNIEAFEDQFNVFHQYDTKDSNGNYAVTHSAEIFLIDPETRIVAKFTPPISTQKVTQQFQELVGYVQTENNTI